MIRADGSDPWDVGAAMFSPASWLPDRDELLIRRRDGAVVIETPEGVEVRVLLEPYVDGNERGWVQGFPDPTGSRVAYFERRWRDDLPQDPNTPAGEWGESSDVTYSGLGIVGVDGSGRRELVSLDPRLGRQVLPFGWTAGGGVLLFVTAPIEGGEEVLDGAPLFAVDVVSGAVHDLGVRVSVLQGGGSSTGERAVFVAGEGRETWTGKRLAVIDSRSWTMEQLTAPGVAAGWPTPTRDGREIAYVGSPDLGAGGRDPGAGVEADLGDGCGRVEHAAGVAGR